jgi:protein TonB
MTQSYSTQFLDASPSSLDGASLSLPALTESEAPPAPLRATEPRRGPSVPGAKRGELAVIVALSALLHTGAAVAALTAREDAPRPRPLSRVQIQVARPRATPAVVPPAPPPRVQPKPVATPLTRREPVARHAAPSEQPAVVDAPIDTGSSASAAENGTLFAGSGGLGTAAPVLPPPPAPVAAPAPPPPVVQAREGANYAKNPRPPYPGLARRQGWEGTTLLSVQVTAGGKAGSVRVQRSSGRAALDDAALAAVKSWTFVPATQGGAPVAGVVTVPIVFKLQ